jgi:hypothetical protein
MTTAAARSDTGLPEELPRGEVQLWQGKPSWHSLALRAFHVRKVGIYFGLIVAWRLAIGSQYPTPLTSVLADTVPLLLIAVCTMAILSLLAWIYARSTTYTITNRRVFMQIGAALPMMLNLPFRVIGTAGVKVYGDGTADIPLRLIGTGRVAYLHLWPFARPWQLRHPEPMLRSVPDGARIAALLASALNDAAPPPVSKAVDHVVSRNAGNTAEPLSTPAAA